MKTIEELKSASLVELAENAKEWKIKTIHAMDNWFSLIIFRQYINDLPESFENIFRYLPVREGGSLIIETAPEQTTEELLYSIRRPGNI